MKLTLPSPFDIGGIAAFAESFDGYEWCGSVLAAAKLARRRPRRSIEDLRAELFFEFRASRHAAEDWYIDVYRELMWHFLRVARETNLEIEVFSAPEDLCDAHRSERVPLVERIDRSGKLPLPGSLGPGGAGIAEKTYVELQKEIEALQREADRKRREEAVDALARIKNAIHVYGFTATDLGFSDLASDSHETLRVLLPTKATQKSNAEQAYKYRDKNGNVWSGRGPRPAWFRKAIADGIRPEDMLAP